MKVIVVKPFDPVHYNVGDMIEVEPYSPLISNGSVQALEPMPEEPKKRVKKAK